MLGAHTRRENAGEHTPSPRHTPRVSPAMTTYVEHTEKGKHSKHSSHAISFEFEFESSSTLMRNKGTGKAYVDWVITPESARASQVKGKARSGNSRGVSIRELASVASQQLCGWMMDERTK